MSKKEFNKKVFTIKFLIILFIGLALGLSCLFSTQIEKLLGIGYKDSGYVSNKTIENSDLKIHYINVGQGDSTFIELPDGTNMLIDAGTASGGKHVAFYLQSLGIKQIDYFVLTHSDADHSGGAKRILDTFEIKTIYRPFQISVDKQNKPIKEEELGGYYLSNGKCNIVDTVTYRNFIVGAYSEKYIENGVEKLSEIWVTFDGIKITSSQAGIDFEITFFAPLLRDGASAFSGIRTQGYPTKFYGKDSSESKNNASPVILLEYNNSSYVWTGDLNTEVEDEVYDSLTTQEKEMFKDVDIFQAGHHGSKGSNGEKLIKLMTANYVVVSVGEGNDYGHPHEEFLNIIKSYNHDVSDYLLRTDKLGDITFGFDELGTLVYTANSEGYGETVYWWQIAIGIFVVCVIIIVSVKVTKNKKATAKRIVKKTRQVSQLYKKGK